MGAPARSGRAHRQDERWAHALGAQGGAGGGLQQRSGGGGHAAARRPGDTASVRETVCEAGEQIATVAGEETSERVNPEGPKEVVLDQGYHSNEVLTKLAEWEVRSYCSEPERGRRRWEGKKEEQAAVYANRRRIQGERGKRLLRQRGEKLERSFAHLYETGGMRRVDLRRHPNILKRLLVHVAAFNLGLVMRQLLGRGTPRGLQGRSEEHTSELQSQSNL